MSPTLTQAKERRWWIAITSIIENLLFAAVLLGWSSLLLMLKNEGFYSSVCGDIDNSTLVNETEVVENNLIHVIDVKNVGNNSSFNYPTCSAQDEILNRYFSIGSCLLSGVTVLLGVIMDKYGCRIMRLCGCFTFMISCIFFIVGSQNTEEYSILIAPAVCFNGMGGVVYVFTSFQVPNLFEDIRSTMISLMIGSYSASAIVYMIFKALYDMGVSFQTLMTIHACLAAATFVNCYFNIPMKPFPGPDDISYSIRFKHKEMRYDHKVTGQKFLLQSSSVGRRMSNLDIAPNESIQNIDINNNNDSVIEPFHKILLTPCVLWSFVTMCLTQLRLIAYMGWLELYFKAASTHSKFTPEQQSETVDKYISIFGLFQINCFFMAPIIGTIMDWKLKDCVDEVEPQMGAAELERRNSRIALMEQNIENKTTNANTNGHTNGKDRKNKINETKKQKKQKKVTRKLQQIRNLCRAFTVTNVLLILFGILILFEEILPLQYVSFALHTVVRTFLHSSMGGLYACIYHFSHFGKLTGLASFLSAMFILIQDPLFVFTTGTLGGDPFWVNLVQLLLCVLGFGLPIYLWMCGRRLVKEYTQEIRKSSDETKNSQVKLSKINEEELDDDEDDAHHRVKFTEDLEEANFIGSNASVLSKEHFDRLLQDEQEAFTSLSAITF